MTNTKTYKKTNTKCPIPSPKDPATFLAAECRLKPSYNKIFCQKFPPKTDQPKGKRFFWEVFSNAISNGEQVERKLPIANIASVQYLISMGAKQGNVMQKSLAV